jgi:hypothetical protein
VVGGRGYPASREDEPKSRVYPGVLRFCPGYYDFKGESNRRQNGNYNGGIMQYLIHMTEVKKEMERQKPDHHPCLGLPTALNLTIAGEPATSTAIKICDSAESLDASFHKTLFVQLYVT